MKDDVGVDKTTITEAAQVVSAYDRWAPFYDLVFTAAMRAGREAVVTALGPAPRRVLDVGVGTGLELPMFPSSTRVVGIDLAESMLRRAQQRVRRRRLSGVEGLCVMDATQLAFADESFDAAILPYVLTVVPEPEAMMDEVLRVLKRGGDLILVNHFGADSGPIAAIEAWLGKRAASLGWHPQFPFSVLGDWLARQPGVRVMERRRVGPLKLFTVVRLHKTGA